MTSPVSPTEPALHLETTVSRKTSGEVNVRLTVRFGGSCHTRALLLHYTHYPRVDHDPVSNNVERDRL
jgi:hypothetical protein